MHDTHPTTQPDGSGLSEHPEPLAVRPVKRRVLVVDDEASITRLLKLNLEQTNEFEVRTETRGEAALVAAQEFSPELIVLDIMMPGIGGDSLAPLLRERLANRPPKIVFLTALASKGEPYSGPDRILSKPVDLNEVLRCIRQELTMR